MIKDKITDLINAGAFNHIEEFKKLELSTFKLKKRFSIMKIDNPFPLGDNFYGINCCFFLYSFGYLMKTFYCEVTGQGLELENVKVNCYPYPCNDINRANDWEWVDFE